MRHPNEDVKPKREVMTKFHGLKFSGFIDDARRFR